MEDWKIRQEVYHRLHKDHTDDLNTKQITISKNVVEDAIRYFNETNIGWIYPSKSYMVGICYARWLAENFGGDPLDYLKDDFLLYGNDPYFLPYDKDPKTYSKILDKVKWNFDESLGMVPDVKEYFKQEFML